MKIYTKTGDKGKTSLYGGKKVMKNDARIETCGNIDELNSLIGYIRFLNKNQKISEQLAIIQNLLFDLGAEISTPFEKISEKKEKYNYMIQLYSVEKLEIWIDDITKELPVLKNFILPYGNQITSLTHISRSVCRRAERSMTNIIIEEVLREECLMFINRLSDYLFTLARYFSKIENIEESIWVPNKIDI